MTSPISDPSTAPVPANTLFPPNPSPNASSEPTPTQSPRLRPSLPLTPPPGASSSPPHSSSIASPSSILSSPKYQSTEGEESEEDVLISTTFVSESSSASRSREEDQNDASTCDPQVLSQIQVQPREQAERVIASLLSPLSRAPSLTATETSVSDESIYADADSSTASVSPSTYASSSMGIGNGSGNGSGLGRVPLAFPLPPPLIPVSRTFLAPPPPSTPSSNPASTPSVPTFVAAPSQSHTSYLPSHNSSHDQNQSPARAEDQPEKQAPIPNVYINGLPAHFPEDQLFALCAPFGGVRSVRTFTRHVSERPTGYGFVLFDTMEGAEKCIERLRRYRNLHPSLSKQVHKIPGTAYVHAYPHGAGPGSSSASSSDFGERREGEDRETFKARMERLHDLASTNLYIEGLPLSIDEPTLVALVSPYPIKSSRFFQTKLSHPPRIIAFVRLETRTAAEEIIERLHGRMVRGWNDAGSRISVRFADTSEQRELRRTERSTRGDEYSPSRLTIAQATLLNMRGQELRVQPRKAPMHVPHPSTSLPNDFELVQAQSRHVASPASPYHRYANVDQDMAILLESFGRSGAASPFDHGYAPAAAVDYHARSQAAATAAAAHHLHSQALHNAHAPDMHALSMSMQAHNGYTPAEELILKAHAAGVGRGQARPAASRTGSAVYMGNRHHSQVAQVFSPTAPPQLLPQMSAEEEFHASAPAQRLSSYQPELQFSETRKNIATQGHENYSAHPAPGRSSLSHDSNPLPQPLSFSTRHQKQNTQQNTPALHSHTRSTTLPHPSSQFAQRHHSYRSQHQHSISIIPPKTTSFNYSPLVGRNNGIFEHDSSNTSPNIITRHNDDDNDHSISSNVNARNSNTKQYESTHFRRPSHLFSNDPDAFDIDNTSPALVSPALTYSSRTPSTLSPATPFFGSFGHGDDMFDASAAGGKKLRAGSQ